MWVWWLVGDMILVCCFVLWLEVFVVEEECIELVYIEFMGVYV